LRNIPELLTTEEQQTYNILIEGYNTLRHKQLWPRVSMADILEWENYKKHVIARISERITQNAKTETRNRK
jgi:hypothetical protein